LVYFDIVVVLALTIDYINYISNAATNENQMKTIKNAVLTATQVIAIEKLFTKFSKVLHIQDEETRGNGNVFVNVFVGGCGICNGWDKSEHEAFGFDSMFSACYDYLINE